MSRFTLISQPTFDVLVTAVDFDAFFDDEVRGPLDAPRSGSSASLTVSGSRGSCALAESGNTSCPPSRGLSQVSSRSWWPSHELTFLRTAHTLTNLATSYLLITPFNYYDSDASME